MNLKKIFEMQKKLDKKIHVTHEIKDSGNVKSKRLIALFVELAELANEVQFFKYWKKEKNIKRNLVLEEYADGIHFLSSFALDLNLEEIIEPTIVSENLNLQFLKTISLIIKLNDFFTKESIKEVFSHYLGIAKILNISDEEILEEYTKKNLINFQRILDKY